MVASRLGPSVLRALLRRACVVRVMSMLRLSAGLAWGVMGALFSSKAAWRSWGQDLTAQQVCSSFSAALPHPPVCSLQGEGADGSPGKFQFPSQAVMCSQPHASWTRSSSLLFFRVGTSCAQSELSYCTATVLPPGATPRPMEGAGRGWRPPCSWPQDCWPQDFPGMTKSLQQWTSRSGFTLCQHLGQAVQWACWHCCHAAHRL